MIFIVRPMNCRCAAVIEIVIYSPRGPRTRTGRGGGGFLYFRGVINNRAVPVSRIEADYHRIAEPLSPARHQASTRGHLSA